MKKIMILMAMILPLAAFAKKEKITNVRWCTFNIRCMASVDTENGVGWETRKDRVCQWVLDQHLDVVGMQEVTHQQMLDVQERLPEYGFVGVGRTDGKEAGEYTPVFYRKDRFQALDKGNFWLSETPDVPGSRGWDAALERVASWVKLKDLQTGKIFMAVNTHFDHVGVQARRESAKLIMRKIQEIVGDRPAVVTGDFNVTDRDEAYKTMVTDQFVMKDAWKESPVRCGVGYTYHNYSKIPPQRAHKIDFIFITPQISVSRTLIPQNSPAYPLSDHNPHWADLSF